MSLGRTWDGVEIVPGLIVWTNEFRVGKVDTSYEHSPGWFDVKYRNGASVMQNAERVATTFTGTRGREVAQDVYLWGHDWVFPGGQRNCALCGAQEDNGGRCPEAPQSRADDKIVRKHGEE